MVKKHNAGPILAALSIALAACTRPPATPLPPVQPGGTGIPGSPESGRSEDSVSPGPPASRTPSPAPAVPALRAAPQDRLVGTRPLVRLSPADFTLGSLEDLSGTSPEPRTSAAEAARVFLDGLLEGRVDGTVPDARDVIVFMLGDLTDGDLRIRRWRLGRGIWRPEGGWIFPILLENPEGRILGEAVVGEAPGTGWGLELVVLVRDADPGEPGGSAGLFDPTIRTVKPTGR